jgi:nucleotide-binding universal stress UspA family protein
MRITKILLAVDGSDQAQRAANYAANLARLMDASIIVAHCYNPMPIGVDQIYPQLMDEIVALAEGVAAPYVAQLQEAGLRKVEARIIEGAAGEKLADLAKDEGCDLIVLGSRGRTQLAGLLLGSVAQRVLHYASCPVLVIR